MFISGTCIEREARKRAVKQLGGWEGFRQLTVMRQEMIGTAAT
jgi:hypothetical protein